MRIIKGEFSSPFYIMVKDYNKLEVHELFQLLKIDRYKYEIQEKIVEKGLLDLEVLYVIRRGDWIQIMDNWGYTLWHDPQIRTDIERLSKTYEIFHFSVGDIDYDYDFAYYKNGILKRKFAIEVRSSENITIKESIGIKLPAESVIHKLTEPLDIVFRIAKSLGITFNHTINDIKVFSKNQKASQKTQNKKEAKDISIFRTLRRFFRL